MSSIWAGITGEKKKWIRTKKAGKRSWETTEVNTKLVKIGKKNSWFGINN